MAVKFSPALLLVLAILCVTGACSRESAPGRAREMAAAAAPQPRAKLQATPEPVAAEQSRRYIAVRQFIVIEAPAEALESIHRAALARCQLPQCELLESAFTKGSEYEPPRGSIKLRVIPDALADFIAKAAQEGELIERRSEAEDKTDRVIDTEARIKNQLELRERLRKLLKSEGAKLKDLIEIEHELARVQTELDSADGMRKALANETEKVALAIELRAKRRFSESGTFTALKEALTQSGRTLAESLATLITFAVAVLPWGIILYILFAGIRAWRRRRKTLPPRQS
jgi:Domain of unknown function (DUF4349)